MRRVARSRHRSKRRVDRQRQRRRLAGHGEDGWIGPSRDECRPVPELGSDGGGNAGERRGIDAEDHGVADRATGAGGLLDDRHGAGDARDRPVRRGHRPIRQGRIIAGNHAHIGHRLIGSLVSLRLTPGGGLADRVRPEGDGEDQEQGRSRVAQRAPGDLPSADRGHGSPAPDEQPLGELGQSGHDPDGEQRPGDQADRRGTHEDGIDPQDVPDVAGQWRAVGPELGESQQGEDDKRHVEADALAKGARELAPRGQPDRAAVEQSDERRQTEDRPGRGTGHERAGDHRGPDRCQIERSRAGDGGSRGQRDDDEGHARCQQRGRAGDEDRLADRQRRELPRRGASGAEERELGSSAVIQDGGDEDDRIAGEEGELKRDQQHARPADEGRSAHLLEDARQCLRRLDRRRSWHDRREPARHGRQPRA